MCLTTVYSKKERKEIKLKKENGYYVGYKIVQKKGNNIYGYVVNESKPLARDKWLNEKDFRTSEYRTYLNIEYGKKYKAGFHVYIERPYTSYYDEILMKVYFKKYSCIGIQGCYNTVITDEIFIPKEK